MSLALSKVFDPIDYRELSSELAIVDRHFTREREQHTHRRWEYALAIRAINTWRDTTRGSDPRIIYDVGGAGSPFRHMYSPMTIVDPADPASYSLEGFCVPGTELAHVVTCLSVLEHVKDPDHFCYLLECLVAPGGLLFLTFDYALDTGTGWPVDHYHFHWMRERIFNRWARRQLLVGFFRRFDVLGGEDFTEPSEPAVYDYTFASLALRKRS